jgi:hypothetical protein
MYVKLSWKAVEDENWAIMVVQPAILTYPTMVFTSDLLHRSYLNKYVHRGLCLIYISSFYFWSPPLARKMRKTNVLYYPVYPSRSWHPTWGPEGNENIGKPSYFNLPPDIGFTLFTPIKGRIDSLTVYIYKAETCTNILRYNTCMSSYPGNR